MQAEKWSVPTCVSGGTTCAQAAIACVRDGADAVRPPLGHRVPVRRLLDNSGLNLTVASFMMATRDERFMTSVAFGW